MNFASKKTGKDLSLADLQSVEPRISQAVFDVLSIDASVASRASYGGTAPSQVKQQIQALRSLLSAD